MGINRYKLQVGTTLSNGTQIVRYYTARTPGSRARSHFDYICHCGVFFSGRCDWEYGCKENTKYIPNCGCDKDTTYADTCKRCGAPRDFKWERALCTACFNEESKLSAREKKGGVIYLPAQSKIGLDPTATYYERACAICERGFLPRLKKNIYCPACQIITDKVRALVTSIHRSQSKRVSVSLSDLTDISKRWIHTAACVYCNRAFSETVRKSLDHILPVARGGGNEASNIAVCCLPCNMMKGGMTVPEWLDHCARVSAHALVGLATEKLPNKVDFSSY